MFVYLIFLSKSDELELETLKSDLSEKLYFEEKTLFCNEKSFHYKFYTAHNKKNIKMRISTLKGGSTRPEAEELEILKSQIMKGKHRSNYYIVSVYDGAAEYYCNKLYRFISVFETDFTSLSTRNSNIKTLLSNSPSCSKFHFTNSKINKDKQILKD